MKALIAIGTNCNQSDNALAVRETLGAMFGSDIRFTRFLKTRPEEGGDGYYINALAEIRTGMTLAQLKAWFKQFETSCGRNAEDSGDGFIPIDIDILQYGNHKYKERDWQRHYVQTLLKELRPDGRS